MKGIFKTINKIIILFIVVGFLTAFIDYYRMKNGEIPVFNQIQYNSKTKKEVFRGLFYSAERRVSSSIDEGLSDSSDIQYKLLLFPLDVSLKKTTNNDFTVFGQGSLECDGISKLYFANLNVKVYTYCLDGIFINKEEDTLLSYLEKDDSILNQIDNKFGYTGLFNQSIMTFQSREESSLTMYRCQGENMNDIYFTPVGVSVQPDFCTYKDDDFSFLFEVVDESLADSSSDEKEVFYEDANSIYQVDKNKGDYLFAVVPEVRGKSEVKISLKLALQNGLLTMDDILKKSTIFQKIEKENASFENNTIG